MNRWDRKWRKLVASARQSEDTAPPAVEWATIQEQVKRSSGANEPMWPDETHALMEAWVHWSGLGVRWSMGLAVVLVFWANSHGGGASRWAWEEEPWVVQESQHPLNALVLQFP